MATIKECTALRPGKDVVTKVATLLYDVVTAQQAKKIAQNLKKETKPKQLSRQVQEVESKIQNQ